MKKVFIVLLCFLFLIGCGRNISTSGYREDIGSGRVDESVASDIERSIRNINIDTAREIPIVDFIVSPELAFDIANAVFLAWGHEGWGGSVSPEWFEESMYYIHDFDEFYLVSRTAPQRLGILERSKYVAICKINGRILSIMAF